MFTQFRQISLHSIFYYIATTHAAEGECEKRGKAGTTHIDNIVTGFRYPCLQCKSISKGGYEKGKPDSTSKDLTRASRLALLYKTGVAG